MVELYVKNEKEELIGEVKLTLVNGGDGGDGEEHPLNKVGKMVIVGYSKDETVMELGLFRAKEKEGLVFKVEGVNDGYHKKLEGFAKYLQQRKKAGLINLPDSDILYILPPLEVPSGQRMEIRCCLKSLIDKMDKDKDKINVNMNIKSSNTSNISTSTSSQKNSHSNSNSNSSGSGSGSGKDKISSTSSESAKNPKPDKPNDIEQPKTEQPKTGFLGSLMRKMESTTKLVSEVTGPKIKKVENYLVVLDRKTRVQLDELMEDTDRNELELEPMDKPRRRLIHDIIGNDYPEFVSCSVGYHDDDKYVMVFRKGFEPEGAEIKSTAVQGNNTRPSKIASTKPNNRKEGGNKDPVFEAQELVRVHQVKRDRRTLEEIQQDMETSKTKRSKQDTDD